MVRRGFHVRKGFHVKRRKPKRPKKSHRPKRHKKPHKRGYHVRVKKKTTTAKARTAAKKRKRKAVHSHRGFQTRFGPEYSTPETQQELLGRKAYVTRIGGRRVR